MEIYKPDEESNENAWQAHNQAAWDRLAGGRHPLTRPAEDHWFADPLKCVDPPGWLGNSIKGQHVLCLAAGGGRQAPLYAAAGASVTVVDLSAEMLQTDREVARQRQLDVRTVQTSMDNLSMFQPGCFDLVIHPVSTCYVADVRPVYREVARVLRGAGLYISQHKQPASLQARLETGAQGGYEITEPYYRTDPLPVFEGRSGLREHGTQEYVHRWEQLLGCMCRAGFVIEDLLEPCHAKDNCEPGSLAHRSRFLAPYVLVKAVRRVPAKTVLQK